jgi:hypothetical protein
LIYALVGMAICEMMSAQVQEWTQQAGSPNLYWALTSLPRPLIDLRKAAEYEADLLYLMYPVLRNVGRTSGTPEYWKGYIDKLVTGLAGLEGSAIGGWEPTRGWLVVLNSYPAARRTLVAQGRPVGEVDVMPVAQVVLLHALQTYDDVRDRMFRCFCLPYWQAAEWMRKDQWYLANEATRPGTLPFVSLLPAVVTAKLHEARTERAITLLRTIEAIRIYGAAHQGQLPDKLSAVTEVPVPTDPVTGNAFEYQLRGDVATLKAPAPPGRDRYARHFEIRFVQ